jgi:hypothetical protein
VGILPPAHKVTDLRGYVWEIYVSRVEPTGSRLRRELTSWLRPQREPEDRPPEALRVEAVTYLPNREAYVWITTTDHVERVLAQIEAGLEQGALARPLGATFHGRGS